MNILISNIFDLKRKELLSSLDKKLLSITDDLSSKGILRSSIYIKQSFAAAKEIAEKIIDSYFESYKEVKKETGKNIAEGKEGELNNDLNSIVADESQRVNTIINDIVKKAKLDPPKELGYFYTNLQVYARQRKDIFFGIEKLKNKEILVSSIVFISYAGEELALGDFIKKILKKWTKEKIEVFIAKRDIPPGANPLKVMMEEKLKYAEAIIPVCSEKSQKSSWVWWETASIWGRNKKIYPLFTNISPNKFGAPLTLVSQGQEYFNREEFINTLKSVCKQFGIDASSQILDEEEVDEYKKLTSEYLKKETSAKVDIGYKELIIEQDFHKYSLSVEILNRSERAFEDIVFELYFPTKYLEKKEWDYPHLTASIAEDDKNYTCLTFMFSGLNDLAKKQFLKDLLPGKKLKIFGENGITKLHYEMDKERWWQRFNFEIKWILYINKGAPQEGAIPLNSIQNF